MAERLSRVAPQLGILEPTAIRHPPSVSTGERFTIETDVRCRERDGEGCRSSRALRVDVAGERVLEEALDIPKGETQTFAVDVAINQPGTVGIRSCQGTQGFNSCVISTRSSIAVDGPTIPGAPLVSVSPPSDRVPGGEQLSDAFSINGTTYRATLAAVRQTATDTEVDIQTRRIGSDLIADLTAAVFVNRERVDTVDLGTPTGDGNTTTLSVDAASGDELIITVRDAGARGLAVLKTTLNGAAEPSGVSPATRVLIGGLGGGVAGLAIGVLR